MAATNNLCPHKDRPHHAKGRCRDCYKQMRNEDKRNTLLNLKAQITGRVPEVPAERPAPAPTNGPPSSPLPKALNTFDSAVVDHCVRALIACQMDAVKAVKKIAGHESKAVQEEMVEILRTDLRIKNALHHDLEVLGLDEESKKKFLAEMTRWLYNGDDPRLKATAARVFAKAFIAERIEEKRIEDLPIRDLSAGIEAMMAEAPKYDEKPN